jgi:hypothetical protein
MLSFSLRPLLVAAFTFAAGSGAVWAQSPNGDQDSGLPLEPERWARFTTDEGTWISLDVSSDGERIVFDLLGDLYTIPVAGGTATRITHGIAHDMQPRFSPDGTEVVFVSDRSGDENVWLLDIEDGEVRPLTTGEDSRYLSPVWTPDGNYIVVSRAPPLQGLEKLWLYHVRGGRGLDVVGVAAAPLEQHVGLVTPVAAAPVAAAAVPAGAGDPGRAQSRLAGRGGPVVGHPGDGRPDRAEWCAVSSPCRCPPPPSVRVAVRTALPPLTRPELPTSAPAWWLPSPDAGRSSPPSSPAADMQKWRSGWHTELLRRRRGERGRSARGAPG